LIKNILKDADFQKKLLWLNSGIPLVLLLIDWSRGNLGANPPEALIRTTGVLAIIFLILSLAVTPLVQYFKLSWS
jgi:sulfoxide reductase heme-binding subunit YedZ